MTNLHASFFVCAVTCGIMIGGCIRLTGIVYKPVPDPQINDFVRIVNVSGTTIELADGSRYKIMGIRAGESDMAKEVFSRELKNMTINSSVLLETYDSRVRVIKNAGYPIPQQPGIVLFPTVKEVPPIRGDVALFLIREGYACAQLSDIPDEKLRKEYETAEFDAKHGRRGIWSDAPAKGEPTPMRKSE